MKEKDILPFLNGLGWKCSKDEAGDYFCLMDIGCIEVQIIPSIGKRSDYFRVSFMPSVSVKAFTEAVSFILGEAKNYVPVIVSNDIPEKISGFSFDDVKRLSEQAISWASAQNLEEGLAAYRALPTDSKGAMPLRHLAALAIACDVDRLASYKRSFDQGDRLGFVPYITKDMIERALLIASDAR